MVERQTQIRRMRPASTVIIVSVAAALVYWNSRQPPSAVATQGMVTVPMVIPHRSPPPVERIPDPSPAGPVPEQPAVAKPSLIGFWRDDFYGKRIFQFREDGTATMVIELDAVGQLLYGPKLTFFIDWTLEEDVLKLKMTGGEPNGTAVTVAKIFGESSEQRIEGMEENELRLRSLDSKKLYTHRRVAGWE